MDKIMADKAADTIEAISELFKTLPLDVPDVYTVDKKGKKKPLPPGPSLDKILDGKA